MPFAWRPEAYAVVLGGCDLASFRQFLGGSQYEDDLTTGHDLKGERHGTTKISTAIPELKLKQRREKIKTLKEYLEVVDVLDDDFANVCEARMHGSCEWISAKASYVKWRDGESGNDRTLWAKGKAATGKSVVAGYVIDQLKESGQACSYFFFKHGDQSKSNLGRCLRSLAFQMASSNAEATDAILEMQADGVCLDRVDERRPSGESSSSLAPPGPQ
ncbi:hypothetical protein V8C34DRAFT_309781 [Trichoderma compactum]